MVNLDFHAGHISAHKIDGLPRIPIEQSSTGNYAITGAGFVKNLSQISLQHIVTGIAPIAIDISPCLPELITGISSLWCTPLNGQSLKGGYSKAWLLCSRCCGRGKPNNYGAN
jgi:hypothetical protein